VCVFDVAGVLHMLVCVFELFYLPDGVYGFEVLPCVSCMHFMC